MTCIVGVQTETGVMLGGDSLGSNGYTGTSFQAPKVFRLTPQVAAGYTSSFRMGQLLQHQLTPPTLHGDELAWAIREFIPAARELFKSHGYAHVQNNEEEGGVFLLAVRRRLFTVQADYSVLESRYPFDAVGSGEYHAKAAMWTLATRKTVKSPRALLKAGLDAASAFVVSVAPPYNFTSTTL